MDVRPLAPEHLDEVTELVAGHVSPELDRNTARLRDYLDRHYRTGPGCHPDIPSLVAVDGAGGVAGFCGVTTSTMSWRGEPIVLAASGPLIANPEARGIAPGLFLTKAMLAGGQDLAITDGANDDSTNLWQRMGAEIVALPSMRWVRPLRPSSTAMSMLAERAGALRPLVGRTGVVDRLAMRRFRPAPVDTVDRAIEAAELVDLADRVGAGFELSPRYEPATLTWKLDELAQVEIKGSLVVRAVATTAGRDLGWFAYHLQPDGICRVMQIGCRPADGRAVLAQLCDHAMRHDGGVLFGRLESHVWDAIRDQPVIVVRKAPRVLIHAADAELRNAVHAGRTLLTRLEGEAWNGIHHQPMPTIDPLA